MCTVVTMFTLKRDGKLLLGPINKEMLASFGPKELVFQWAQRRATKRGFGPDSGKTVQVVTDGDQNRSSRTATRTWQTTRSATCLMPSTCSMSTTPWNMSGRWALVCTRKARRSSNSGTRKPGPRL